MLERQQVLIAELERGVLHAEIPRRTSGLPVVKV